MYKEIINTSHKLSTKKYNKDMGNPKAFLTIPRQEAGYRPIHDRISDYSEVEQTLNSRDRKLQASRCMDCGVPFCQAGIMIGGMASGCPLNNLIPEWNDLVYQGKWELALRRLRTTNRFPEFTSRVCPALCEAACTCGDVTGSSVTVRENEHAIVETGYA